MELKWNKFLSTTMPETNRTVLLCLDYKDVQPVYEVCSVGRSQMGDIYLHYWRYDGDRYIYPETANRCACTRMRWAYIPDPEG